MVALLVLATFVVFITVDVLLHREKYKFRVAETETPQAKDGPLPVVAGVTLPEALAYHPGHAWALDAGNGRIRIGLDEFAASLLGSIEKVEVPQRGRWFRQGEKGWSVITPQGEATMLAPAEGEIVAVNDKALADPAVITKDPYGAGWLLEIFSPDTQVSFRNLLTGALAKRWMEQSMMELRQALAPMATMTALDGGRISPQLGTELPQEKWREVTRHFFRS
ncbi:MAG TPA: glycine cleavage system protein H [Bryobacteraceae bacterium]|nr:glycine cleavage system protein H [Bryobacteraceae bacterium]HOQ44472.1 glycine cleavage system protein H [Bryobacteraceae bacterium]HPQ16437.1 glycine cleavage system protein H [Bryobacteraceae bacterium]HPU70791.1 glycine cleavage system protein H [Bryobacteraceae bacterium]